MAFSWIRNWTRKKNQAIASESELQSVLPEIAQDLIYRFDLSKKKELRLTWANESLLKFFQFDGPLPSEGIEWESWPTVPPEDQEILETKKEASLRGLPFQAEYRVITKSGETVWIRDVTKIYKDPNDSDTVRVYGSIQDIHLRKKNEIALRDQLEYIQILLDSTDEWVVQLNRSGNVQYVNSSGRQEVKNQFGISLFKGIELSSLISPEHKEIFTAQLAKAFAGEKVKWHFSRLFPTEKNSELEVSFAPLKREGTIKEAVVFLKDVTLRTVWETALLASEEKYRKLVEVCPDGIGLHSNGKLIYLNDSGLRILGYTSPQEVEGRSISDFVHPDSRALMAERIRKSLESKVQAAAIEEKFLRKDGTEVYVEVTGIAFQQRNSDFMQVIFRDISERKKSQQELTDLRKKIMLTNDRLKAILQGVNDSICAVDMDMRIMACNTSFELLVWRLYGKRVTEGNYITDVFITDAKERNTVVENWSRALRGEVFRVERRVSGLIDENLVFEINYSSIRDFSHNMVGATQVIRDVTERYQYEETLRISLNEKEMMLKEIHHRVKNNLQVVSSLLGLQAEFVDDPKLVSIIQECERRIRSMALIHKELYQNESISDADFREYLNNLLIALVQSYGASRKVKYLVQSEELKLNLDYAIPLALVLNELVSNSLKYAFPGDRTGNIRIAIYRADERLILEMSDDGIGLPPGFDIRQSESLGLQLVGMLLGKLKADWELLPSESGAHYRILLSGLP
ncbi:PAS domain S-box protein [Leptospira fletcheri]|uniref:histidine kinase n=1 Tax=Leptospira fletcheri TaxID=2484981 RepID=A0A4V3JE34_9LEPT|nr:PAS domain S-box protein [Leptospira fletcheri]TGK13975.1 PAS domain S-box protein [Leptospira fletcheri]